MKKNAILIEIEPKMRSFFINLKANFIFFVCVCVALLFLGGYSSAYAYTAYTYFDDFDSETPGEPPNLIPPGEPGDYNWVPGDYNELYDGGAPEIFVQSGGGFFINSLRIVRTESGTSHPTFVGRVDPNCDGSGLSHRVYWDMVSEQKPSPSTASFQIELYDYGIPLAGAVCTVRYQNNTIWYQDGDGLHDTHLEFDANVPNRFYVQLDLVTKIFQLYITRAAVPGDFCYPDCDFVSVHVGENRPFQFSASAGEQLRGFFFANNDESNTGVGYAIDDIRFQAVDLPDTDDDFRPDCMDNCPNNANAGQEDGDADGVGDACDNCPIHPNAGQEDGDTDGVGDACDNCPDDANAGQEDGDADGVGNVCDNCDDVPNPLQEDKDSDGLGDVCDEYAMGEDPVDKPDIAAVVAPSPDGTIYVDVTVTFKAIPGVEPTNYVRPDPYNTLLRLKDTGGADIPAKFVRCGPPCSLPEDLVEVFSTDVSKDYSTRIPLSYWYPNMTPGDYTFDVSYFNYCDDPRKNPDGSCPSIDPDDCQDWIWQGEEEVEASVAITIGDQNLVDQCPGDAYGPGEGAGNTGCEVADKNTVWLHTLNLGKGPSTKELLQDVRVRVFDRNSTDFQDAFGSKNPHGSQYGVIFRASESDPYPYSTGLIGACTTDVNGVCYVGEAAEGEYLVIVKYEDTINGKVVYVGRPKGPGDFVDGIAEKNFQIMKVYKKGVFQGYRGGKKTVVEGSILEMITPESAIWEGTQSVYPFIFTSDSDWTVDVCARVPEGYSIVGVYDEYGDLIPWNTPFL